MKWHHAGIQVSNLNDSIQFYKRMFGFSFEKYLMFQDEKIVFLRNENVQIELIESEENKAPLHSIHIAWQLEDIEDWIRKLKKEGLYPLEGPYSLKNGWITVFYEGPDREIIELIQVNRI
ncbi:VOC family protein [Cytobacillus massiliigabonensis]|uniref:VOC family protein n=1 Tax=Cytobacillus massiliigabonensis TaxID=1871011 RepID=UPI000C827298|nr:VOC family protein [Cytobacillus massiliigabonensis]